MPGLDGYEICSILKRNKEFHDLPAIFIGALIDTDEKLETCRQGGVDYITKSFAEEETLARVQAQIALKRFCERMKRLNLNLRAIFSVISHYFRKPFVGLLSFPEIVASKIAMSESGLQELVECSLEQA